MRLRNTGDRYGLVSIILHWLVAATILAMLFTGYFVWRHPEGPVHVYWIRTHAAIGVTMWLVVAARAIWHFVERQPRRLSGNAALNNVATFVHTTLLLLIGFQLISGPFNLWSGGYPVGIYDWLTIPNPIAGKFRAEHDAIGEVHILTGRIIAALVFLHLCGVAKHVFIDADGTLSRMLGKAPA